MEEEVEIIRDYRYKEGDIITCGHSGNYSWTCILKETPYGIFGDYFISDYCSLDCKGDFVPYDSKSDSATWIKLATEEERERLFKAIKDNGYKWNEDTMILEKETSNVRTLND